MKRYVVLLYGSACYVYFLGALAYLAGFVNNFAVPKGIDSGEASSITTALLINIGLVGLFGLQHSLMARPGFKAWWTRMVPKPIERSTYVLFTSIILTVLYVAWQPITSAAWSVETPVIVYGLYTIQVLGWGLVLLSSFLINHFELFGLQQVFLHWRGRPRRSPKFRLPFLYRLIRHPLMLGFLIGFWCTPHMSVGRLLFSVAMTAYIFIGIHYEERDLVEEFGEDYQKYRKETPMLVPYSKRVNRDIQIP